MYIDNVCIYIYIYTHMYIHKCVCPDPAWEAGEPVFGGTNTADEQAAILYNTSISLSLCITYIYIHIIHACITYYAIL